MKPDNPFTLTFGKKPPEYIERYENTDAIVSTFAAEHPVSQTYLIEGIRGSGKTVLMTSIARELASNDRWIVIDLNATRDLLHDFAVKLEEKSKRVADYLKSGFQISVAGFGAGISGSSSPPEDPVVIERHLEELKKRNRKILLTIDEVQHDLNMRRFASEFQILVRNDYPVYLLMTGLYENIQAIQNDPSMTFLLRSPKIHLKPLSLMQIKKQYGQIFKLGADEAEELANITCGYAFAFQALGMLYYEQRDNLTLDEIILMLEDMLEDFVYQKIWEGLSSQDRKIMKAIPEEPIAVKDLREILSMKSEVFSRYRERLAKRDLISTERYGYVSHALPRFINVIASYK